MDEYNAVSSNRNNLHQAHHTETVSDEESEDGQIEIQCLEWKNKARLNISHQFLKGNANCYRFERHFQEDSKSKYKDE